MDVYTTEEQQVEVIKKWWKENGISVLAGVGLGLAAVFGWKAWVAHQASVGEQASVVFEQLMGAVQAGARESADRQAELLSAKYESTPYAEFAALAQARMLLDAGDNVSARARLQWALEHTAEAGLKQVARLRLARVLLSDGDLDGAEEALRGADAGSFAGEFSHVQGDIAAAREDFAGARNAYQHALENGVGSADLVQMKLDDLPPVATPAAAGQS
jgi:predicted negative regulator of RcsB-dependent stress response